MTFPQTPRAVLAELKVGSTDWANISSYVQQRGGGVRITRGTSGEQSQTPPQTCDLILNNRDGIFSPRNPMSPLYGQIGQSTPLRVSIGIGKYGMVTPSTDGRAECDDSAALSFTGDMDLRVDLETLTDPWNILSFDLASQFQNTIGGCRFTYILVSGVPRLTWFPTGTYPAGVQVANATTALPPTLGRLAQRVTLDVDNGAAGWTVRFYTAPTIAGPWTQLGTDVTGAGVTSLFDIPDRLRIGSAMATTLHSWGSTADCVWYSAELRNGIGGTVVASPDFTAQPLDPVPFALSNFSDAQGNDWWFRGTADAARIWYGDVSYRFYGEVAEFPPRWDTSGEDAWVPLSAAGELRRLQQGEDPPETGLKAFVLSNYGDNLMTYYPLDGAEGTTYSVNLGAAYNRSTRFYAEGAAVFTYGVDMGTFLGTGMELNATGETTNMRGDVGSGYPVNAFEFVWQSANVGDMRWELFDYNGRRWHVHFILDEIHIDLQDETGVTTTLYDSGVRDELVDTGIHHLRFQLADVAGDVAWDLYLDGSNVTSGLQAGVTTGGLALFRVYYTRTSPETVVNIAHLTVWGGLLGNEYPTAAETAAVALGNVGEFAADRIERVAGTMGVPIDIVGFNVLTAPMGAHYAEEPLTVIREAEAADLGILYEPADGPGLVYRTRESMYNQTPVVTLDFSQHQLEEPFEPIEDDQYTRNDITVSRRDGGNYRYTKETGAKSAADPPNGAGRYRDSTTVNLESDDQLPPYAGWLVALGTVDDYRYSKIQTRFENPHVLAAGLEADLLAADIGDCIAVTNVDNRNIYDTIDQIILGYTETINAFEHVIAFVCSPGAVFRVGELDSLTTGRLSSGEDSVLNAAIDSDDTSLSVLSSNSLLWTTDAGDVPVSIVIGGEEMTLTAVSGTTPGAAQTFTVTRSVNGVVKSHSAGAKVRLKQPMRLAL